MFLVLPKILFEKCLLFTLMASFFLTVGWSQSAEASWQVTPVKLAFDAGSRSDVVTITNNDDRPLSLEISALQWLQDPEGKDEYQPTNDLIFFPKQLVVPPKSERVIRTGIKVPAVTVEKTYRLFIKEVADKKQLNPNTVAISVQFGIPVFVKPIEEKISGAITETSMVDGKVSVRTENLGNSHFRINSITFNGQPDAGDLLFSQVVTGWYLLQGNSRTFSTTIPNELCRKTKRIDIMVIADRIEFNGKIDVDPTMCPAL